MLSAVLLQVSLVSLGGVVSAAGRGCGLLSFVWPRLLQSSPAAWWPLYGQVRLLFGTNDLQSTALIKWAKFGLFLSTSLWPPVVVVWRKFMPILQHLSQQASANPFHHTSGLDTGVWAPLVWGSGLGGGAHVVCCFAASLACVSGWRRVGCGARVWSAFFCLASSPAVVTCRLVAVVWASSLAFWNKWPSEHSFDKMSEVWPFPEHYIYCTS